jgi:hypothetical protein
MKRLLTAVFLLFYAAFTVLLSAEHTLSWVQDFASQLNSQPAAKGIHSAHSSQKRFIEHPFTVRPVPIEFPLITAKTKAYALCAGRFIDDIDRPILARAPPVCL